MPARAALPRRAPSGSPRGPRHPQAGAAGTSPRPCRPRRRWLCHAARYAARAITSSAPWGRRPSSEFEPPTGDGLEKVRPIAVPFSTVR